MLNRLKNKILSRIARKNRQYKVKDTFIKSNKLFWSSKEKQYNNNEKIVLVEISEKNPFELESNMRVAKAIEHIQGMDIVVLLSGLSKIREPYYRLAESYLVSKVILTSSIIKKASHFIGNLLSAYKIYSEIKTLVDIENIKYEELQFL